jgi:hypothetical protein
MKNMDTHFKRGRNNMKNLNLLAIITGSLILTACGGNKIDGEWSSLDEGLDFIISDDELIVLQDSESLDKCVIEDQVYAKVVCESGAEMYMELKGDKIILSSRNIGFNVSGRGYLRGFGPIMITVLTKKE